MTRATGVAGPRSGSAGEASPAGAAATTAIPRLAVRGVTVDFGGLRALDNVSLGLGPGQIVSLIGPNGAGKTTLFNVISGFQMPSTGDVELDGRPLGTLSAVERARRGMQRTFQRIELFDELTALENLLVTRELSRRRSLLAGILTGPGADRGAVSDAQEVLAYLGLLDLADLPAAELSTGQRRLLELGRVLVTEASLVLLDEPSSGLDRVETARFNEIVLGVRAANPDAAVLLVEHDMSVALGIADYVYVLDFGQLIAQGTPSEIRRDERVRVAYLGREEP